MQSGLSSARGSHHDLTGHFDAPFRASLGSEFGTQKTFAIFQQSPKTGRQQAAMIAAMLARSLLLLLAVHMLLDLPLQVHAAALAEAEVRFDLDPASKLQWSRLATSRSDRPVLDRDAMSSEDSSGLRIRPLETVSVTRSNRAKGGSVAQSTATGSVLEPTIFNFGRGVGYTVAADVPVGGELLSLPLERVMSVSSAARGRVGLLLQANPDLPPAIALAVHLLEEHFLGTASNFSELLATLPSVDQLNSSLFYLPSELEELTGSQLLRYTQSRAQAVESFFDALVGPVTSLEAVQPPLFTPEQFTLESFRWAIGVVWACAFPVDEREAGVVLAPVLATIGLCTDDEDVQACPPTRVELDTEAQRLVVRASLHYKAGQEVQLTMPHKPSAQLILNHGFTRAKASTALDKLDLTVALDPNDPLVDVKRFLLQSQLNESMDASYALHYGQQSLDDSLSTSLKIKLLSAAELAKYRELLVFLPTPELRERDQRRIVSLHNEFVFTRAVVTTCRDLLARYPTALEQDRAQLAEMEERGEVDSTRQGQLRRLLVLEKEILHQSMNLALRDWGALVLSSHPNLHDPLP